MQLIMVRQLVQTELRARELMKMGLNVKIMLIGKKGATYFKRRSEIFNIAGVLQSPQGDAALAGCPVMGPVSALHGRRWCSGTLACMCTLHSAAIRTQPILPAQRSICALLLAAY